VNQLLQFEFTERDLVEISRLENAGYKFIEVVMRDRNGFERFVKIVAPSPVNPEAQPK
jgi:hypothetical protein